MTSEICFISFLVRRRQLDVEWQLTVFFILDNYDSSIKLCKCKHKTVAVADFVCGAQIFEWISVLIGIWINRWLTPNCWARSVCVCVCVIHDRNTIFADIVYVVCEWSVNALRYRTLTLAAAKFLSSIVVVFVSSSNRVSYRACTSTSFEVYVWTITTNKPNDKSNSRQSVPISEISMHEKVTANGK